MGIVDLSRGVCEGSILERMGSEAIRGKLTGS